LNTKHSELVGISKSATVAQDMLAIAIKQVQVDFMEMSMATAQQNLYLQEYNKVLNTSLGQAVHFQKGIVAQRQALLDSKIQVLESAGAYSELVKQMQTGEPQTIAYTQAVIDQKTALEQSKIEVYALQGTLDTLRQQYASGEQSIVAFNKGFIEQKTSLIQTAIAVDTTRGAIAALTQDMASGFAQQVAWNKGLEEGRLAIMQTTVSLEEQKGGLTAQAEALADGTLEQQAFTQATIEFSEGLISSVTDIAKLSQGILDYTEALKDGIPQSLAYAKSYLEVQMNALKLQETLGSLMGTYQATAAAQDDMKLAITKGNVAFLEGTTSIQEWNQSLFDTKNNTLGMTAELIKTSEKFSTDMPKSLYASIDAMKEWIAIQSDMPGAVEAGLAKAIDKGKEKIDELTEAWKKGNRLSEKEIDKLLGVDLPDKLDKKVDLIFRFEVNESEFKKDMDEKMGAVAKLVERDSKVGAQVGSAVVSSLKQGLHDAWQDGKISDSFYSQVNTLLNSMPSPDDSEGFKKWIASWSELSDAIERGDTKKIDEIMTALSSKKADVAAAAESLKTYKEALDGVVSTVSAYNQIKSDEGDKLQFGGGVGVGVGSTTSKPATGDPGVVADTTGLDSAQEKLNLFKAAMTALPGFINEQVTAANASFLPLGDPLLNEVPTKILTFSNALAIMPQYITESVVVPVNTALIALGDPFTVEIPQKILQFSQTIAQLPGFVASNVVAPVISNFVGMANAIQSGAFTKIQRDAAVAATAVTNIFRSEAAKLATIFDAAVSNAISAFNRMQSAAASTMSSIVSSANNARSSVQNLASAINSLQSRTITITTINRTINETVNAAAGFGPAVVTHPTRLLVG
jgi:hypothetical protein